MTKQVFVEKSLECLYSHFNVEKSDDSIFRTLYSSLSDWLIAIDNHRDCITTYIIRSNKAQNFIVPRNEKKSFVLVWDVSFWQYYSDFLLTFFSYDALLNDDFIDKKTKKDLWSNTEAFFRNSILDFLSNRFEKNKDANKLFFDFKKNYTEALEICTTNNIKQMIQSIVALSKEFVLIHELEHILCHINPEIYMQDSKVFDNVLKYYHDVLIDDIDESISHIPSKEFKKIVDNILKNKDKNEYSELYSDYHAFFEFLLHHGENIQNTELPFSKKIPNYLFAIKLLKMFESCINYATQIIDCVISTRFQKFDERKKRVVETSFEYRKTIYNRDYLSIELFTVSLMLYAEEFSVDLNSFADSIDPSSFVMPYTQIMQPQFNGLMEELINKLVVFVK